MRGRLVKHRTRAPAHGYKAHIAADKDTGIIRNVETTAANEPDVNIAPSIIPDEPGEVYADRAYDALSVEKAIEAKGGTSKLMRKGHRWLPAARLEAHNRPLRPIRARIKKSSAPGNAAIIFARCDGWAWPKQDCKFISRRLPTISNAIGGCKARERISKPRPPRTPAKIAALDADLAGRGHPNPSRSYPSTPIHLRRGRPHPAHKSRNM